MKTPIIPSFNVSGIEEKIQKLQTALGENITWLEYSFGKCERHEKIVNEETEVYPVCFVNNQTDPIDVRPNDDYQSYAFWDITDPGRIEYPNPELNFALRKYAIWEYDAALIVWVNLKRTDDSVYIETKSQMRQDILNSLEKDIIGSDVAFWATQVYDRDITKIFAEYDLDNSYNINKWPYVAFRVNGVIRFKRKCPIDYTYSVTTQT